MILIKLGVNLLRLLGPVVLSAGVRLATAAQVNPTSMPTFEPIRQVVAPPEAQAPKPKDQGAMESLLSRYRRDIYHYQPVTVSNDFREAVKRTLDAARIRTDVKPDRTRIVMTLNDWVWLFHEAMHRYKWSEAEMVQRLQRMRARYEDLGPRLRQIIEQEEKAREGMTARRRVRLPSFLDMAWSPLLRLVSTRLFEEWIAGDDAINLRLLGYVSYVAWVKDGRSVSPKIIEQDLNALKLALEDERHLAGGLEAYLKWYNGLPAQRRQQIGRARNDLLGLERRLVRAAVLPLASRAKPEDLKKATNTARDAVRAIFPKTAILPGRVEDEDLFDSFLIFSYQHPETFTQDVALMRRLLPYLERVYGKTDIEEVLLFTDSTSLRAMTAGGVSSATVDYQNEATRLYNRLWVERLFYWTQFFKEELNGDWAKLEAFVSDMQATR